MNKNITIKTINENKLDENTTIWKYLSFEKFLNILVKKELFFANLEKMQDKYEGTTNEATDKAEYNRIINTVPFTLKKEAMNFVNGQKNIINDNRKNIYVNCWSINEEENFALWKIYLDKSKYGIAIKTNIKNILNCFNGFNPLIYQFQFDELEIKFKKVDYNGKITKINVYSIASNKKEWYFYEKEFRGIIFPPDEMLKMDNIENGLSVIIDPSILIKEIYTPPFASEWFYELVKNTINKYLVKQYRIEVPIKKSNIKEKI